MSNFLIVGMGGFVGSSLRYLTGVWILRLTSAHPFPFATLIVNVTGCLLIGFLGGFAEGRQLFSESLKLFLMVGLLGGFTTFSTFGYETMQLVRSAQMSFVLVNIFLQLFLGLAAAGVGYSLSKLL